MNAFADLMAAWRATYGVDPIAAGVFGNLADHECEHGRLPSDRTEPCGCWPSEKARIIAREAGG